MIKAKWKKGIGFFNQADPDKVAQEIRSIGKSATPQQIVDKARNTDTELHKCFEWNDSIAAENWRRQQARVIVCNLVIKEETMPTDRPEIRYFFKPNPDEGYKSTQVIVKKEDEYQKLLVQAWAELQAFKVKYAMLNELQEIFELIK